MSNLLNIILSFKNKEYIVEKLINFKKEISVVISRYKEKSVSFDAFENESKVAYENEQNILANEYTLATDPRIKEKKLNQRIDSAIEYENIHQKGKAWLDETVGKIKGDSELLEVEKAVTNKNYSLATELLKQSKI